MAKWLYCQFIPQCEAFNSFKIFQISWISVSDFFIFSSMSHTIKEYCQYPIRKTNTEQANFIWNILFHLLFVGQFLSLWSALNLEDLDTSLAGRTVCKLPFSSSRLRWGTFCLNVSTKDRYFEVISTLLSKATKPAQFSMFISNKICFYNLLSPIYFSVFLSQLQFFL